MYDSENLAIALIVNFLESQRVLYSLVSKRERSFEMFVLQNTFSGIGCRPET